MASISGIVYLIIGLAVSISSFVLNLTTKSNALTLFIFIGIAFIIVGVVKLLVNRPGSQQGERHAAQRPAVHHQAQQHSSPHPAPHTAQQVPHPAAQHTAHSQYHPQGSPQTRPIPPPTATTFTKPDAEFVPRNRMEEMLYQEERKEERTPSSGHLAHPPIVTCPRCGRRQYRTSAACFICKGPI